MSFKSGTHISLANRNSLRILTVERRHLEQTPQVDRSPTALYNRRRMVLACYSEAALEASLLHLVYYSGSALDEADGDLHFASPGRHAILAACTSLNAMITDFKNINACLDFESKRCGRLLNWQNPNDPFWHYGIGISDLHVFDTGRGLRVFERANCLRVAGVDGIHYTPKITIGRLMHALEAFKGWHYSLLGWNCEHMARLIATNKPRCYQSKLVWWLAGLDANGDHKIAKKVFEKHLRKHAPELL